MPQGPAVLERRELGEWQFAARGDYDNPFTGVVVDATFEGPSGQRQVVPAFYDGEGTWKVRFSPSEAGQWRWLVESRPADPGLRAEGELTVEESDAPGFLQATPGEAWGFCLESGRPVLVFGDTTYNLFGMAHCGGPVVDFLERRCGQGINLLRVRLQVSPYHPPNAYSRWQDRSTWPWGGSPQVPRLDRFNLDYFRTVDRVVGRCASLGLGLEMIMEAWGFEFPFNSRDRFTAEREDLWMRYLLARYDAYRSVWFWTLMNEYEFYPDGNPRHSEMADRWAMRRARWVKETSGNGHVVAVHNTAQMPPFARRFEKDPGAIDAVMFQHWGSTGEEDGWLAAGIERGIRKSLADWPGSAVLAEYGYERNPDFEEERFPGFRYCDVDHTRRGGWRGLFSGLGIIHGWENSWGPDMVLDRDQAGMEHFLQMNRFFHGIVPFHRVRPAPEAVPEGDHAPGREPLALADPEGTLAAIYLPAGGPVRPALPGRGHRARWFDPRTGELSAASRTSEGEFDPPGGGGRRPWDWVLVLEAQ